MDFHALGKAGKSRMSRLDGGATDAVVLNLQLPLSATAVFVHSQRDVDPPSLCMPNHVGHGLSQCQCQCLVDVGRQRRRWHLYDELDIRAQQGKSRGGKLGDQSRGPYPADGFADLIQGPSRRLLQLGQLLLGCRPIVQQQAPRQLGLQHHQ
jgi:hypothetical protein